MPTLLTLRTHHQTFSPARMPAAQPLVSTLLGEANRLLLGAVETVELWGARKRQRQDLRALSDHLLHDIGRSRADAEAESTKRFWQA